MARPTDPADLHGGVAVAQYITLDHLRSLVELTEKLPASTPVKLDGDICRVLYWDGSEICFRRCQE